jgi:hypothetical protein
MKRFTETQKWDDPWFRSLPGAHKLVFLYLLDRCNNAGFWEEDLDGMAFHTKIEPHALEGALKGLARGLQGASGWYWVKNFLRHQKNDCLNPDNPAHRQIIALLLDQSERFPESKSLLPEGACKGLTSPIGIGKGKGRGKGNGTGQEADSKIHPFRSRIGKLLGRRESTQWSKDEIAALKAIATPSDEEWFQIEAFYAANIPKEDDFRRTDIIRLLKYWTGELDKARAYCFANQIKYTPKP